MLVHFRVKIFIDLLAVVCFHGLYLVSDFLHAFIYLVLDLLLCLEVLALVLGF